jgi:hypothetical protein
MKHTKPPITLDKVKLAFNQWRANKQGRYIPKALWDQVDALTAFYKPWLIRKALGISGSQYSNHIPRSKSPQTFVEVPVKSLAIKNHLRQSKLTQGSLADIEIYRVDGSHLCIKYLDEYAVSNLIQTFLG